MRVYVDTSVFGGVFDPEFSDASSQFFRQVSMGIFSIVVSDVTIAELDKSPDCVKKYLDEMKHAYELVGIDADMIALQGKYIERGIVGGKYRNDALHVAAATVSGCPVIVSWNFKHIVHQQKIPQYNGVNLLAGYSALQIYSPREVILYEDE
ncbi:MAG TPA: hypothetical protein PKM65_09030 [Spirochaetota bacterium]|nr:hypothetical protein [Spirochaetota bacterium]HNT12426.1 hypothetical protein [Spirochaetota bacterium]